MSETSPVLETTPAPTVMQRWRNSEWRCSFTFTTFNNMMSVVDVIIIVAFLVPILYYLSQPISNTPLFITAILISVFNGYQLLLTMFEVGYWWYHYPIFEFGENMPWNKTFGLIKDLFEWAVPPVTVLYFFCGVPSDNLNTSVEQSLYLVTYAYCIYEVITILISIIILLFAGCLICILRKKVEKPLNIPDEKMGTRFTYPDVESHPMESTNANCCVCLEEYKNDEKILSLPCQHHAHDACLTPWIRDKGTCPLCKESVLKETVEEMIK